MSELDRYLSCSRRSLVNLTCVTQSDRSTTRVQAHTRSPSPGIMLQSAGTIDRRGECGGRGCAGDGMLAAQCKELRCAANASVDMR